MRINTESSKLMVSSYQKLVPLLLLLEWVGQDRLAHANPGLKAMGPMRIPYFRSHNVLKVCEVEK